MEPIDCLAGWIRWFTDWMSCLQSIRKRRRMSLNFNSSHNYSLNYFPINYPQRNGRESCASWQQRWPALIPMQHVVCEWMTGELLFRIHSTSDSIADGWMSLDNLWARELKFALNPCVFVVWLVGCLEHHQFSSIFIGPRRHGHSTICLFLLLRRSGFCLECSTLCCCWWMTVFRDYYEKFVHKILCPEYLLNGLCSDCGQYWLCCRGTRKRMKKINLKQCQPFWLDGSFEKQRSNGSLVIDYFDAEI